MYESVRPWLGGRVMELGVGRGNLSRFIRRHEHVLLTDDRLDYLSRLQEKWKHANDLHIARLDMTVREDYEILRQFRPDSIVFLNVLEHIEDDRAMLANLYETAPAGCHLAILVRYNPKLYSDFDRELGHFRRYAHRELEEKMAACGWRVEKQFFFNKFGVIAWYLANTLGRQKALTPWQLKIYNLLTPFLRVLDRILPTSGLSTVVVGSKPELLKEAPAVG